MAVVRPRSAPPYATIIFVFLWVIATGVAIWLGVKKGEVEKLSETANQRADAAGKRADAAVLAAQHLKDTIENAQGKTGDEVVGDGVTAREKAGFATGDLITAIKTLSDQVNSQKQLVTQLQAQKDDLDNQLKAKIASTSAEVAAIQQSLNQEKTLRSTAEGNATKERTDKESLLTQKEADLTKFKDTAEQTRRQQILEIEKLNQDVASRDTQIVQLRQQLAAKRAGNNSLAIQPAGTIIRAQPGTTDCYISLGRADRITPGMTFSVHDPRIGIKLQADTDLTNSKPDPEAGGKGSVEVSEVGEHESLCRVTSLKKGQHIEAGDLIANLFYSQDRNRKFHFVVFGDFDLDGDGVATPAEHDRLVRMITAWGGIVDDQLTPETDYLVLGDRPTAPSTKASSETGGVADERLHLQTQYDNLFSDAKRSSVPILDENRFLAFIGYYNNTVVH